MNCSKTLRRVPCCRNCKWQISVPYIVMRLVDPGIFWKEDLTLLVTSLNLPTGLPLGPAYQAWFTVGLLNLHGIHCEAVFFCFFRRTQDFLMIYTWIFQVCILLCLFTQKNLPKGRNFRYIEDPGIQCEMIRTAQVDTNRPVTRWASSTRCKWSYTVTPYTWPGQTGYWGCNLL